MARKWFTPETTKMRDLSNDDLAILNRAARLIADNNAGSITRTELAYIYQSYRRGMSAADLAEMAVNEATHDQ